MTFGEKLRLARNAKDLTQKEFADLIGAKHNSVSDWERDKSKPDMDMVELICGALDLTPTYLMGTKSDEEYGDIIGELMNQPELLDLARCFKDLSKEDKKAIMQIVNSLSKNRGA